MSQYVVFVTKDAKQDLSDLYDYLNRHAPEGRADEILNQLEVVIKSLSTQPMRGNWPDELLDIGISEYRELFYKPYRVLYRVTEQQIYVMLITDGRRDMQALLQRRLFRR